VQALILAFRLITDASGNVKPARPSCRLCATPESDFQIAQTGLYSDLTKVQIRTMNGPP